MNGADEVGGDAMSDTATPTVEVDAMDEGVAEDGKTADVANGDVVDALASEDAPAVEDGLVMEPVPDDEDETKNPTSDVSRPAESYPGIGAAIAMFGEQKQRQQQQQHPHRFGLNGRSRSNNAAAAAPLTDEEKKVASLPAPDAARVLAELKVQLEGEEEPTPRPLWMLMPHQTLDQKEFVENLRRGANEETNVNSLHSVIPPPLEREGGRLTEAQIRSSNETTRRTLRQIRRERRARGRNIARREFFMVDSSGTPASRLHKDDFMSNGQEIDPAAYVVRNRRRQLYRDLWIEAHLERSWIYLRQPPPLSYNSVKEENDRDTKILKARLADMLASVGGNENHKDYIEFEEYHTKQNRDVGFARLNRILIDGEGDTSRGANVMINYLKGMLKTNNPHGSLNRLRSGRAFRDTSPFQEMMITIATIPKVATGSYKNHPLMFVIMLMLFPQYLKKEMTLNVRISGRQSAGKSFILKTVQRISVPNSALLYAHISNMAQMTDVHDISDVLYLIEEAPVGIFLALTGKSDTNAQQLTLWKNKLTSREQRFSVLHYTSDGLRMTLEGAVEAGNGYGVAMNDLPANMALDEAMLSRFANISIDGSLMDTARHPANSSGSDGSIPADAQLVEQNVRRFREHQTIAYVASKAMVTGKIIPVLMDYARILMFHILDVAASLGATETRHARRLERVSMAIETVCLLRSVYHFYFLQTIATEKAFPATEQFKLGHISRIEPTLVPFLEEIVFCLLLFASEFQDRSVELIGSAIRALWFGQENDMAVKRLRRKISNHQKVAELDAWFSNPEISEEHRISPLEFERKYLVSAGFHAHNKAVPTAGEISWWAVDPDRFCIQNTDMEKFKKNILEFVDTNGKRHDLNVSGAFVSLSSPTSIMKRDPIPHTARYTEHVTGNDAEPRMLTFVSDGGQDRMAVYVSRTLIDGKRTTRPVFEAINKVLGRRTERGPMWLVPETLDDGGSQWCQYRTEITPNAESISFPEIQRLSQLEREIQVRMNTQLALGRVDDEQYDRKWEDARELAATAFAPLPALDLSKHGGIEGFDEFCLKQRFAQTGIRPEMLDREEYAWLKHVTPAQWRAKADAELGPNYDKTKIPKYEDLTQFNFWNSQGLQRGVVDHFAVPAGAPRTAEDAKDQKAGNRARLPRQLSRAAGAIRAGGSRGAAVGANGASRMQQLSRDGRPPAAAAAAAAAASAAQSEADAYLGENPETSYPDAYEEKEATVAPATAAPIRSQFQARTTGR